MTATDGLRSSTDVATGPCAFPTIAAAAITAPVAGAAVTAGAPITLAGAAGDVDAGTLAFARLSSRSSRDGDLGRGGSLPVRLSPGRHDIVLTATDDEGAAGHGEDERRRRSRARRDGPHGAQARPRRRAGASAVALTFSEDVVGLGSAAIVVPGAGRITGSSTSRARVARRSASSAA